MDAKPQRPPRALRATDENAPLANALPGKQVLKKNKSTPSLSNLMQNAAQRVGGKRTVFADVSNTTRAQPAQDDSVINAKVPKPAILESQKPTALMKPAQKPLAAKVSVQTLTSIPVQPVISSGSAQQSQPLVNRKIVTKRSTLVLKDVANVEAVASQEEVEEDVEDVNAQDDAVVLPELDDTTTEKSGAAPGPVQPINTPVVPSSTKEDIIRVLELQAQAIETTRDVTVASEGAQSNADDSEYFEEEEVDEFDGDPTTTALVLNPKYTTRVKKELIEAKCLVESSRSADDIEEEHWDTSMVAEYGDEIFEYMRGLEARMRPNAHYMEHQNEIQWSMRSVLVDWVVQVHHRFQLLPETLFLAVNYIDRFLSVKVVSVGKLQLVGATALFLAAKYEEVNCPSIQEIVYMVDNGYTVEEILRAERYMLSMLSFELGWPGPMSFLRRISKADDYDLETRTLAKYFLEITICDERFLDCSPSFLAAGAHCLARLMLRKGNWTSAHVHYSNYTYSQMRYLLASMVDCCNEPETHHNAVYQKYTDRRFKRASLFVQTEMNNGFRLPTYRKTNNTLGSNDW